MADKSGTTDTVCIEPINAKRIKNSIENNTMPDICISIVLSLQYNNLIPNKINAQTISTSEKTMFIGLLPTLSKFMLKGKKERVAIKTAKIMILVCFSLLFIFILKKPTLATSKGYA